MPGYRKKRQSLAIRIGKKFLEWQQVSLKKLRIKLFGKQ